MDRSEQITRNQIEHHVGQIAFLIADLSRQPVDDMFGDIDHIADQLRLIRVQHRKMEKGERSEAVHKLRDAGL